MTGNEPMTSPAAGRPDAGPADPAALMLGIAAALTAAGLAADLDQTAAGRYVTAVMRQPGQRETEVILDEDGYIELRWWAAPGATAEEIAGAVTRALSAITARPAAAGEAARGSARS